MKKSAYSAILLTMSLMVGMQPVAAAVYEVLNDYGTIQGAIDATEDGDTILVDHGTYTENIDFDGKNIVLIGDPTDPTMVVIDGDGEGRVVTMEDGCDDAVMTGFTIENGDATQNQFPVGGGIFCDNYWTGYFRPDSVSCGPAYWLALAHDRVDIDVEGVDNVDTVAIALDMVWNIIGNPFPAAGSHTAAWNAVNRSAGIYIVRMEAPGFSSAQKVFLVK